LAYRKNTFVCPEIDFYAATLGPRQLGHGMDYYRSRSSMPGYGLGSWFAKFFRFVLPLSKKKYVASIALDFASSILQNWGSGKDFKEVHKISGPVIPRQVVEITTKWERL